MVRVPHAALAVRGHRRVLAAVPAAGRVGAAGLVVPAAAGADDRVERGQERQEDEGAARIPVHGGHRQPHLLWRSAGSGGGCELGGCHRPLHPLHSPVSSLLSQSASVQFSRAGRPTGPKKSMLLSSSLTLH